MTQTPTLTRRALGKNLLGLVALGAGWQASPASASISSPVPESARILVGFGAGGTIDVLARILAERIAPKLGPKHHIIVENKAGANGQIAAQALLNAPADGASYLITPLITPVLSQLVFHKPGYDPAVDFAPVGLVAHFQFALAVPTNHPAKNLKEFVAWLKANPTKANFGSPAAGSLPHFFGLLLGRAAGVDIVHVPYKGGPALFSDLVGAQLTSAIETTSGLGPLHREGKVRILATFTDKRTADTPDVPSISEAGFPQAQGSGWYSLWARKGTPPAAVEAVNRALNQALLEPSVKAKLQELSLEADPRTPQQLEQLRVADVAKWRPVIDASGFKAD